jgi:hypothetical protein
MYVLKTSDFAGQASRLGQTIGMVARKAFGRLLNAEASNAFLMAIFAPELNAAATIPSTPILFSPFSTPSPTRSA